VDQLDGLRMFSKKLENLEHAVAIQYMHYNSCIQLARDSGNGSRRNSSC
jgi:hypothetical protein